MSSFKAFDIAGSGMAAQSVRLNTTASNLANADSVSGTAANVYKPRHPIFEAVRAQLAAQGATAESQPAVRVRGIYESTAAPSQRF
jgi:flagellar basal-body rod protein FlgC